MLTRPRITEELITQIRQIIEVNPDWGRERISKHLCELWDWRVPGGCVKDISCRDMLRALDKAGKIELPAPLRPIGKNPRKAVEHLQHNTAAIVIGLRDLRPLNIEVVEKGAALMEFKSLIDQYHYLGFDRTIGENMKYTVRGKDGAVLACLLFGSAAWSCKDRDIYIGWDREQRSMRLQMLTNNVRFLIVPWVESLHLASHILALISRRISKDWESKYGHGLAALETFVEFGRFRGSCYKGANWQRVGRTTGRGRNDRQHDNALAQKDIYIFPLTRRWREVLLVQ
jgi:hypothetical protein